MRALGFEPSKEEVMRVISDADREGKGSIDYNEFQELMQNKIVQFNGNQGDRNPEEEMRKAFKLFDVSNRKQIGFKELKRVASEMGQVVTDEELNEMIAEADRDGDGELAEEDFIRIMKKTNLF